jgi:hypothetical protein
MLTRLKILVAIKSVQSKHRLAAMQDLTYSQELCEKAEKLLFEALYAIQKMR